MYEFKSWQTLESVHYMYDSSVYWFCYNQCALYVKWTMNKKSDYKINSVWTTK